MSQGNCSNCGVCLCTGAQLLRAEDGRICCTVCIKMVKEEIATYLKQNPGTDIHTLKRLRKLNPLNNV